MIDDFGSEMAFRQAQGGETAKEEVASERVARQKAYMERARGEVVPNKSLRPKKMHRRSALQWLVALHNQALLVPLSLRPSLLGLVRPMSLIARSGSGPNLGGLRLLPYLGPHTRPSIHASRCGPSSRRACSTSGFSRTQRGGLRLRHGLG